MDFRLLTFGDLRLVNGVGEIVPFPEKGLLSICFLLTSPSPEKARLELARFLWGDIPADKALVNLRQTLSRVKSRQDELGTAFLEIGLNSVRVDTTTLTCDLSLLDEAPPSDPSIALTAMLDLTDWELLARTDVTGNHARTWLKAQRGRLKNRLLDALRNAVAALSDDEDPGMVKEAALRLFEIYPDDADVYQIVAQTYTGKAQLDSTRQIFDNRTKYRWGDLPASPDRQTLNVVRKIYERQHRISVSVPQPAPRPADDILSSLAPRGGMPRLVLLPPVNTSRNHPSSILAVALLEDITIGLCALKTVTIMAPYTAERIALDADRVETLRRHDIGYVLETRLASDGTTHWLFVQLIYVGNEEVVWAERFGLEAQDLPRQHRELAQRIVGSVAGYIERNEFSRDYFERYPAAYHQYLLGQRYLKHLGLPEIRRARKAFRGALQENPYFSPALSGIARTYHLEWLVTARGDTKLLKLAEEEAGKAIAAGQDIAAGYREFGVAKLFLGGFDESIEAFEMAETISPHYADVIADYADTLIHASKPQEGLEKVERAIRLNPLSPDVYFWTAAGASYHLERYQDAADYIRRMANPEPATRLAAATAAMMGDNRKAKTLMRKAMETYPDFEIDTWLSIVPIKEEWQKSHYREGLQRAGFK